MAITTLTVNVMPYLFHHKQYFVFYTYEEAKNLLLYLVGIESLEKRNPSLYDILVYLHQPVWPEAKERTWSVVEKKCKIYPSDGKYVFELP